MTGKTPEKHGLNKWNRDIKPREASAAIQYAEHGWPILPGSAWSSDRYVNPRTARATRGLRPLVARKLASADISTVTRWWKGDTSLVPSVLVRCGAVRVSTLCLWSTGWLKWCYRRWSFAAMADRSSIALMRVRCISWLSQEQCFGDNSIFRLVS